MNDYRNKKRRGFLKDYLLGNMKERLVPHQMRQPKSQNVLGSLIACS